MRSFCATPEALAKRLAQKQPDDGSPGVLHGNPEATVLFRNLDAIPASTFSCPTADEDKAALAMRLDFAIRESAPAGGRATKRERRRSSTCSIRYSSATVKQHKRCLRSSRTSGVLMTESIRVGDTVVAVTRKDIKHVHLSVHPPHGRVTLAVPSETRLEVARGVRDLEGRLDPRQQEKLQAQERESSPRLHRAGESLPLGTTAIFCPLLRRM